MKVFFGSSNVRIKRSILTMGNFDGLHRGHQKLISVVRELSKKKKRPSILVTYFPHPLKILRPAAQVAYLLDFKDFKLELKHLGLDFLILENFNKTLSNMKPEEYLKRYIVDPFDPEFLILGNNFFFGVKKSGTLLKLKEWGKKYSYQLVDVSLLKASEVKNVSWSHLNENKVFFQKNEIFNQLRNSFKKNDLIISSTKIKNFLEKGELEKAGFLLGRPYFLRGKIQKGAQRGRKIGYPTLNLKTDDIFLPRSGVYRSSFLIEEKHYSSITNIGMNPTFGAGRKSEIKKRRSIEKKVETHAFLNEKKRVDFLNENFYGKEMTLYLYEFLRPEKKFKSKSDLKTQIHLDTLKCKEIKN